MKKRTFIMAVIAALFTACTSQVDVPEEENSHLSGDRQEVKFTLSGFAGGEVPYTKATTPAYGDESKIERLDIYVFSRPLNGGDYTFEEVFTDVTLHGSGNDKTATIGVLGKDFKCFYALANADFTGLKTLVPGVTTSDEFMLLQTNELDAATKESLTCPLFMIGRESDIYMNPYDGTAVQITLKRRVARFDIENDARLTDFYLKYVTLNNINKAAVLADNNAYVASTDPKPYVWGDKIQYNLRNNANTGIVNSLFYLYPQKGQSIADGGAFITVEGEVGEYPDNAKVTFKVPFINKATGNPIDIKANTRYVIKINAATTSEIDATINTLEWNPATSVEEDMDAGTLQLTDNAGTPLTSDELILDDGTPNQKFETFYVKATSKWEFAESTPSWVQITDKEINGKEVCTRFNLTVPKNQHAAPRNAVITLRNVLRPSVTQSFVIRQTGGTPDTYPGTTLQGTEVCGIIWAPVNVGDTDGSTNGSLFQWGRGDTPLTYNRTTNKPDMIAGPLSRSNASLPANIDKFIKLEQNTPNPNTVAVRSAFIKLCKNYIAEINNKGSYGTLTEPVSTTDWNNWYAGLTSTQITEIATTIFGFADKLEYEAKAFVIAPPYDWTDTPDNNLWNSDPNLITGVNPCPQGWRVPTKEEIQTLINNATYSKGYYTFTDKNTAATVSFRLPDGGVQIGNSGNISTDNNIVPYYWTSNSAVKSVPVEYDPTTGKPTRYEDVYQSEMFQAASKPSVVVKTRAEAHYVRCVLDN